MNQNTLQKALKVQQMVAGHYEPGRQDRCKRWVWLYVVRPVYPMSERTFYRYLKMKAPPNLPEGGEKDRQLKLFE